MAEAYPSERSVEPTGSSGRSAPHRVVPALRGRGGGLSPTFTRPADSAIRHPAEGMAAGLWRKGWDLWAGLGSNAGRWASCGSRGPGGGWGLLGQHGGGVPRRKGRCAQLRCPFCIALKQRRACGAAPERAGASRASMDGSRVQSAMDGSRRWHHGCNGCRPRCSHVLHADGGGLLGRLRGAWGGRLSVLINYPAGTRRCKTSGTCSG